jgi:hypothetical protein
VRMKFKLFHAPDSKYYKTPQSNRSFDSMPEHIVATGLCRYGRHITQGLKLGCLHSNQKDAATNGGEVVCCCIPVSCKQTSTHYSE